MGSKERELIMGSFTPSFLCLTSWRPALFMKALGVGLVTRKLGNKSSPVVTITEEAGEFTMKQESLVKTSEIKFRIGQEFDEVTADGRQVKSKMTLKSPNVMIHEMLGTNGGKDSVCIREFLGDKMVATCKVDDIETVRSYAAV